MSSDHTYPGSEITTHDLPCLERRIVAGGYSLSSIGVDKTADTIRVVIGEDAVSADDLKTALNTSEPEITLTPSSFSIVGDGVATQNVDVTGPNNATIDLRWNGLLPVSAKQVALDGTGNGSFTVGPFAASDGKTGSGMTLQITASKVGGGCTSDQLAITVV